MKLRQRIPAALLVTLALLILEGSAAMSITRSVPDLAASPFFWIAMVYLHGLGIRAWECTAPKK
ncbi:hypothetical protein [Luteolibacter marinus]|uniref:hypothetical protein n=1 Tax=Luteolibacter marinus TaxID=2776705 RepID=UPI001868A137|nr:hypothetical protein [Luteolibacter marinus]